MNTGGEVISRRDFLPFGSELPNSSQPGFSSSLRTTALKYGNDDVRQKFTGYQKDEETGLDFAEARMYNNRHARFTAVDPLLASGKSGSPQTFNRYVYVVNSPLNFTDPTGLQVSGTTQQIEMCQSDSACEGQIGRIENDRIIWDPERTEPIAIREVNIPELTSTSELVAVAVFLNLNLKTTEFLVSKTVPERGAGIGGGGTGGGGGSGGSFIPRLRLQTSSGVARQGNSGSGRIVVPSKYGSQYDQQIANFSQVRQNFDGNHNCPILI